MHAGFPYKESLAVKAGRVPSPARRPLVRVTVRKGGGLVKFKDSMTAATPDLNIRR
jgi:hypothetical protein